MKPFTVLELKHLLAGEELQALILQEASKIDVRHFGRLRFAIELNFDVERETLTSWGLEVRYRKEHAK